MSFGSGTFSWIEDISIDNYIRQVSIPIRMNFRHVLSSSFILILSLGLASCERKCDDKNACLTVNIGSLTDTKEGGCSKDIRYTLKGGGKVYIDKVKSSEVLEMGTTPLSCMYILNYDKMPPGNYKLFIDEKGVWKMKCKVGIKPGPEFNHVFIHYSADTCTVAQAPLPGKE